MTINPMHSPMRDDPSMAGVRPRNESDGRLRQKRGDTHLETIEDKYGEISDRRSDTHLETIRETTGKSLKEMAHSDPEVTHKPGLHGRHRNQDGKLRKKRDDTHLDTIEKTYGEISDRRGDTHLKTIREDYDAKSLSEVLEKRDKNSVPRTLIMDDPDFGSGRRVFKTPDTTDTTVPPGSVPW